MTHPPPISPADIPSLPIPTSTLTSLPSESKECLERLISFPPSSPGEYGIVKQAAVLVLLFQKEGEQGLRVLLTTRAKTLRHHPSQTALPGGKVDPSDPSPIYTARREAFEEVDLSMSHPSIHQITVLPPIISVLPLNAHMKNHIIVTPVVCFVSDLQVINSLQRNEDEVDAIFSHPLRGVIDGEVGSEGLIERGQWWPHDEDFHSIEDRIGTLGAYRMHRFRTTNSPIKGLTSDVLLETCMIAYNRQPTFGRSASGQPDFPSSISKVVKELPGVLANPIPGQSEKWLEWGRIGGDSFKSGEKYELA